MLPSGSISPKLFMALAVLAAVIWPSIKADARMTPLLQTAPPKARVDILFNGKVVTGKTQTILSGQPAHITFAVSGGPSVTRFLWLVPPATVGGFKASVQAGEEFTPVFEQKTLELYWIDHGPKKTVTLLYDLSDREQGRVFTTFDVEGPTDVKVTTQVGTVKIFDNGKKVGLGEGTMKSVGIIFNASATTPPGSNGHFVWVQIIVRDEYQYSRTNGPTLLQRSTGGLDVVESKKTGKASAATAQTYEYDTGRTTNDSPDQDLGSGDDGIYGESREFAANMFLMWKADDNSIPVPLGYVSWYTGWNIMFDQKSKSWKIWQKLATPLPFEPSLQYPYWQHPSKIVDVK